MTPETAVILIVALAALAAFAWYLKRSWGRHRLRGQDRSAVLRKLEAVRAQPDAFRRLLETDALLDETLKRIGYAGTLGDKLKKADRYIPDINAVWRSHKLRNRLAHEPGLQVPSRDLTEAASVLENAILRFCR